MQELLVVNPSRRPSKRRKSTKRASPAQLKARAAFAAMARARSGKKRSASSKRKTASKPSSTSITVMANPKRRRSARRVARRRSNPSARALTAKPMSIITPALTGAVGAVAVNTIMAKIPIPASLNTGKIRYVTQGAAAIGLAMIASKLGIKGTTAAQMAEGALTVTLHQAITDIAGGMGMNLSGVGYYLPGRGVQAFPRPNANPAQLNGMNAYVTGPGAPRASVPLRTPARANNGMRGFQYGR